MWQVLITITKLITKMEKDYDSVVHIITQWDRSDYSSCLPCNVSVSDFGVIQCRDCLCLFIGKQSYKAVQACLRTDYGDLWRSEWDKLKEVQKLVRGEKFDQLVEYVYHYQNKDGIIDNERKFYEKRV
ncbi:hypothetical protein BK005_01960 [bacterium CG10_37_50]|nr:MAG: hypothetical protein BK005_01960 [bacterium CG10_37_50]